MNSALYEVRFSYKCRYSTSHLSSRHIMSLYLVPFAFIILVIYHVTASVSYLCKFHLLKQLRNNLELSQLDWIAVASLATEQR